MKRLLTILILCALPLASQTVESGYRDIPEITAPGNPAADHARWYAKDDGGTTKLCYKDSSGTETCVGAGGGAADLTLWRYTFMFGNDADGIQNNLLGPAMVGSGVIVNGATVNLYDGAPIFGEVDGEILYVFGGKLPASGYDLTAIAVSLGMFSDLNANTNAHEIEFSAACYADGTVGSTTTAAGLTYTTATTLTFTPAATGYALVSQSATHDASAQCSAGEYIVFKLERDETDAATSPVYLHDGEIILPAN